MSKKIAIGIVNTYDDITYNKCVESLPRDVSIASVHNTTVSRLPNNHNRYISYGGVYNIILRELLHTDATYYFLIKSNIIIEDSSIFQDYITTAEVFGTWFMTRGNRGEKSSSIEDDISGVSVSLFENLSNGIIFMLKSHVKNCGYFDEGYTNLTGEDNNNSLELYDYYHKIENKLKYLPKGYFPDAELSLAKTRDLSVAQNRPNLKPYTTDGITYEFAKFYHNNNFAPGQHKTASREEALKSLEYIQKTYGKNI